MVTALNRCIDVFLLLLLFFIINIITVIFIPSVIKIPRVKSNVSEKKLEWQLLVARENVV